MRAFGYFFHGCDEPTEARTARAQFLGAPVWTSEKSRKIFFTEDSGVDRTLRISITAARASRGISFVKKIALVCKLNPGQTRLLTGKCDVFRDDFL